MGHIDSDMTNTELKTFNIVVAANPELKLLNMRELMCRVIETGELNIMLPNLTKLATIGLLLPV